MLVTKIPKDRPKVVMDFHRNHDKNITRVTAAKPNQYQNQNQNRNQVY